MYNLFRKKEVLPNETRFSYYNVKIDKRKKSCGPTDINGFRQRVNYETGEITDYTKKDFKASLDCSVSRTKRLLYLLLLCNSFDWFVTLTFDPKRCNRYDTDEVYKLYTKFVKDIKRRFPSLRYVAVPEAHKNGAIHFHLLVGGVTPKQLGFVNSGKVVCSWATKKGGNCSKEYYERTKEGRTLNITDGLPIYNVMEFKYGFSTATKIASKEACNHYVTKYLHKAFGSTETFKKRFFYSSNLNVPDIIKELIGAELEKPVTLVGELSDIEFDKYIRAAMLFGDINTYRSFDHNVLKLNVPKGLIDDIDNAPEGCELIKLEEGEDPFLQQIF